MVDYSKWKDIEISDDEDDIHQNIDTPSLFRWRHQARVERMEEQEKEKLKIEQEKRELEAKLKAAKAALEKAQKAGLDNLSSLEEGLKIIEKDFVKVQELEEEIKKKERATPWNVDTISKAGFSKTVINIPVNGDDSIELSEEEQGLRMKQFVLKYETQLKKFGMLQKFEDSRQYLMDNDHLVCENTAHHLVVCCINLEMEKKSNLMEHVAHQCICMQFILELSKKLKVDPRACVPSFFSRMQTAEPDYRLAFEDELHSFKERIRKRAEQKLELAMKEIEEEERQASFGPGGLDPVEIFGSLPKELQECFVSQDIPQLQKVLTALPKIDARHHLKRCIDAGLWIPDASINEETKAENEESNEPSSTKEEQLP